MILKAVVNARPQPSPTERGSLTVGDFMTTSAVMPDLWQDYHQRLTQYVAKRISNKSDAEDIVQNVFLKILHVQGKEMYDSPYHIHQEIHIYLTVCDK